VEHINKNNTSAKEAIGLYRMDTISHYSEQTLEPDMPDEERKQLGQMMKPNGDTNSMDAQQWQHNSLP
jgi:hypothetical protein